MFIHKLKIEGTINISYNDSNNDDRVAQISYDEIHENHDNEIEIIYENIGYTSNTFGIPEMGNIVQIGTAQLIEDNKNDCENREEINLMEWQFEPRNLYLYEDLQDNDTSSNSEQITSDDDVIQYNNIFCNCEQSTSNDNNNIQDIKTSCNDEQVILNNNEDSNNSQLIYEEYMKDFEQSDIDMELFMIDSRRKPRINNSAMCTGNMWGKMVPFNETDYYEERHNHWYSLLTRGRERNIEELAKLAMIQQEWDKI